MIERISRRKAIAGAAIAAGALFATAVPVLAHHSTAMFEWGKELPMKHVTVERWEWTNPHTFLYVHDANGTRWAFEGMSPNHLVRYGWSKRSVKPGDEVDIRLTALTGFACQIANGRSPATRAGAPDRIRTCDLCLRRAALYPAELRVRAASA